MITSSILGLFMLVSRLCSFSYSSRRLFCSISVAFYSLFFFSLLCFIFGFQLLLLFAIILSLNDNEVISYLNVFRIIWKAQIYSDIDYFCFSSFYYNFILYMNDELTFVLVEDEKCSQSMIIYSVFVGQKQKLIKTSSQKINFNFTFLLLKSAHGIHVCFARFPNNG